MDMQLFSYVYFPHIKLRTQRQLNVGVLPKDKIMKAENKKNIPVVLGDCLCQ